MVDKRIPDPPASMNASPCPDSFCLRNTYDNTKYKHDLRDIRWRYTKDGR